MRFENLEQYENFMLSEAMEFKQKNESFKLSHLKLQKIMYVTYSYFLIYKNKKICDIEFQAWKWGPVIFDIWMKYKKYGKYPIPLNDIQRYNTKSLDNYKELSYVAEILFKIEVWDLVEICHNEGPWKKIYKPMKNIVINDEWIIRDHENEVLDIYLILDDHIKQKFEQIL